jgi:C4-dicarboxylate transporter/malic acid transport protein
MLSLCDGDENAQLFERHGRFISFKEQFHLIIRLVRYIQEGHVRRRPHRSLAMTLAARPLVPRVPAIAAAARAFTPNWFTASMGTGGFALALHASPLAFPGREVLAEALWGLDVMIFLALSVVYAAQWLFYPHEARVALDHPVQAMFLGAIPMALATVVNGLVVYAPAALPLTVALWAFDAGLAVASGLAAPYLMFTRHEHRWERMTAVWLIPLVAAEVAATSAAALAPHLAGAAYGVVLAGYALWAFSVPPALGVLAALFMRLALHGLPEREFGASGWLALGPLGTGALGLIQLGVAAPAAFAAQGMAQIGEIARGLGLVGGLMLWGYGLWWLGLAALATVRYLRGGLPFNLGWWAFTFPLAVYTLATFALARETGLTVFAIFGDALCAALALVWTIVAVRTLAMLAR